MKKPKKSRVKIKDLGRRLLMKVQDGLSSKNEKAKAEEIILTHIAKNDTKGLSRISRIIELSPASNIFEAVSQWNLINYYELDSDKLEDCQLCGTPIRNVYTMQNEKDPGRKFITGYECMYDLSMKFEAFKEKISGRKKEVKKKKTSQLEEIVLKYGKIRERLEKEVKEKVNLIRSLDTVLEERLDLLDKITEAEPRLLRPDYTICLKGLAGKGSFFGWFEGEKKKGSLPKSILDVYVKAKNDFIEVSDHEFAALYLYSANHRLFNRKALIGSIESDLLLMEKCSEDENNDLVKKYGKVSLAPVRELLNKEYITLIEATKILDMKPNILEIRKEVNAQRFEEYGENFDEIISKVKPIFIDDKGLWYKEYKKEGSQEKTLSKNDYFAIKNFLKKVTISQGTIKENAIKSYSLEEFQKAIEPLILVERKLDFYEQNKEEEIMKGRFFVKEAFSRVNKMEKTLDEVIDKIKYSYCTASSFLGLDKIEKFAKAGIFPKKDIEKLKKKYDALKSYQPLDEKKSSLIEEMRSSPFVKIENPFKEYKYFGERWRNKAESFCNALLTAQKEIEKITPSEREKFGLLKKHENSLFIDGEYKQNKFDLTEKWPPLNLYCKGDFFNHTNPAKINQNYLDFEKYVPLKSDLREKVKYIVKNSPLDFLINDKFEIDSGISEDRLGKEGVFVNREFVESINSFYEEFKIINKKKNEIYSTLQDKKIFDEAAEKGSRVKTCIQGSRYQDKYFLKQLGLYWDHHQKFWYTTTDHPELILRFQKQIAEYNIKNNTSMKLKLSKELF